MKLSKNNNREASTMKKLKALLTAEAAVCIALLTYVAAAGEQGAGGALYGVPFAQIGAGLRTMSLSGAAGNAAAFVLYLIICPVSYTHLTLPTICSV